jgi:hypothetical protein
MNKKGQITEFIILGLVLLLTVLFLIFIANSTQTPEEKFASSKLDSLSFQLFTKSCLEDASNSAMKELGQRAGYLTISPENEISGNVFLTAPNPNIPRGFYPCDKECNLNYVPDTICGDTFKDCSFFLNPSPTLYLLPSLENITQQLESSISSRFIQCLGQGSANKFGRISLDKDPVINIEYDSFAISVNLDVALGIDGESRDLDQKVLIDSRLRLFHNFILELLYRDGADLGFDIENEFPKLSSYLTGFEVEIERSNFEPHDLVTVTDNNIKFIFLRYNLPPSLNTLGTNNEIQVISNTKTTFPLKAFDLNEDEIIYSVFGDNVQIIGSDLIIETSEDMTISISASDGFQSDYEEVLVSIE